MRSLLASQQFRQWVARQRWFSGTATDPRLELTARFPLDLADDGVRGEVLMVDDLDDGARYQIPLSLRVRPLDGLEAIVHDEGGYIYDGARDPDVATALYSLALSGGSREGDGVTVAGTPFTNTAPRPRSSRVLSGEQSNTSIIFDTVGHDGADSNPVIVKVFRLLHAGDNPDVVLQSAIAAAGSARVPRSLGAIVADWGQARGHLAFAQEFLTGTRDAWRVALDAVTADVDFADRARALGEATAEVHGVLATALPTVPADSDRIDELVRSFRVRAAAAMVAAPELSAYADDIDALYREAVAEPWPVLQRIHGDYHLGQVLDVPDRGWVLLDFEGEPLRPMNERNEPDLALRDVAGMLRSFDYAAGSAAMSAPEAAGAAEAWAATARAAFLDGYEQRSGYPLAAHPSLLAALELDKALYEAVYEARNRPDWLPIPVQAVARLVRPGDSVTA